MMYESGMTLDRSVFNDCFRRASRTLRYVCTLPDRYLVSRPIVIRNFITVYDYVTM